MIKALPTCQGWKDFIEAWTPWDLILISRKAMINHAQKIMFECHL